MASLRKKNLKSCFVVSAIFFVIFEFFDLSGAWDHEDCPSFCRCFWLYELRWADCTGHRIYSVQIGIDEAVQALDLSNNSISSLANYELRDAGLTRLKFMNFSANAISEIGLMAFVGLAQLRVLDLSKNHLYSILPDTFMRNERLEVLELAGNNLHQRVPKLKSLSLGSLDLSNCGIGHLAPDTFEALPRLRSLDLSSNMMIQLEMDLFEGLPNLGVLKIEKNPWSCNDHMSKLQNRLKAGGVKFKRVCDENPSRDSNGGEKKFEKMIAQEKAPKINNDRAPGRVPVKVKKSKNSLKPENTQNRCPNGISSKETFYVSESSSFLKNSPFCFLAMGFLVGSAFSTIVTYFWLTKKASRSSLALEPRGTIDTESSEAANQRANLLQYLWQNHEDSARSSILCPGTPPPPYRDVILHSHRYPRPRT